VIVLLNLLTHRTNSAAVVACNPSLLTISTSLRMEDIKLSVCPMFKLIGQLRVRSHYAREHGRNLDKDIQKLAIEDEDLKPLWDWIAGLE
jgi:hypothetical protein